MHRLALQVQVLEESDTHASEAEAVRQLSPASGCVSSSLHRHLMAYLHHVVIGVSWQLLLSQQSQLRGNIASFTCAHMLVLAKQKQVQRAM